MKVDYSDWLFASDIDGTLIDLFRNMPERNITSIKEFVSKGGNFTLCSGRNLQSVAPHYIKSGANSPAIFLNGAGIYDFSEKKMLSYTHFDKKQEDVLISLIRKYHLCAVVYEPEMLHIVGYFNILGIMTFTADKLSRKFYKNIDSVPRGNWGKVGFFGVKSQVRKLCSELDEYSELFEYFPALVTEVAPKGVNKGAAVLQLASILGIDKSNTAAIGDNTNDKSMLSAVSHPGFCGSASSELAGISEFLSVPCKEGAVADFLNYIESKYIN